MSWSRKTSTITPEKITCPAQSRGSSRSWRTVRFRQSLSRARRSYSSGRSRTGAEDLSIDLEEDEDKKGKQKAKGVAGKKRARGFKDESPELAGDGLEQDTAGADLLNDEGQAVEV
jgi:hypothetical protein